MEEALQKNIDTANRHEEKRKQAEERRKRLITLRETIKGMTPEERRAAIEEYRTEMYGERAAPRRGTQPPRTPRQQQPSAPSSEAQPKAE